MFQSQVVRGQSRGQGFQAAEVPEAHAAGGVFHDCYQRAGRHVGDLCLRTGGEQVYKVMCTNTG